jgi:hypothetical protein
MIQGAKLTPNRNPGFWTRLQGEIFYPKNKKQQY